MGKNYTRNLGNILLLKFLYLSYEIWDNSTKSISLKSRFSNYSQSYRRFFVITYYESGGFPLISKWKFRPFFHFELSFSSQNGNFDLFFHFGFSFYSQNGNFDCFFHFELSFSSQNGNFDSFFNFELSFSSQNGNFDCFFHFKYAIIIKNRLK